MKTITKHFQYLDVGFDFQISKDEKIISSNIDACGSWESNQLQLYDSFVPDSGVYLDIGANVGVNSLYMKKLKPSVRVISVEPEKDNYKLLEFNGSEAGLETFNIAIADKCGSIGFSGTGTNASINYESNSLLPCLTLNKFVEQLKISNIDLMKIDVEGYTDLVLSYSDAALSITKNVIVEFSYGDIVKRLNSAGSNSNRSGVLNHTREIFNYLNRFFSSFYYISRFEGLVLLSSIDDLYELMISETGGHQVGDVLACNDVHDSISEIAFVLRSINELKRQNHYRILEVQNLNNAIKIQ